LQTNINDIILSFYRFFVEAFIILQTKEAKLFI